LTKSVQASKNDMHHICEYFTQQRNSKEIDTLPVIPEAYTKALKSTNGEFVQTEDDKKIFSNNFHSFGLSIFDSAALGQFITGTYYPRGQDTSGFINETALH